MYVSLFEFVNVLAVSIYAVLQDSYAIQSFERGIAAQNSRHFSWEVVPVWFLILIWSVSICFLYLPNIIDLYYMQVEVSGGRGKPSTIVDKDDGLGKVNRVVAHLA